MDDFTAACNAEEWRPVVGWEGWYEISNFGRVKRVKAWNGTQAGRILKPYLYTGYPAVDLSRRGKSDRKKVRVHQLVAYAFLGPCPDGLEVNHIDADKMNPALPNLEYITHEENLKHASRTGMIPKGSARPRAKLTEKDVEQIRSLFGHVSHKELAERYGVSKGVIGQIAIWRIWKHVAA